MKKIKFITDPDKIKKGLTESLKTLEQRIKNLENCKRIPYESLLREINI